MACEGEGSGGPTEATAKGARSDPHEVARDSIVCKRARRIVRFAKHEHGGAPARVSPLKLLYTSWAFFGAVEPELCARLTAGTQKAGQREKRRGPNGHEGLLARGAKRYARSATRCTAHRASPRSEKHAHAQGRPSLGVHPTPPSFSYFVLDRRGKKRATRCNTAAWYGASTHRGVGPGDDSAHVAKSCLSKVRCDD